MASRIGIDSSMGQPVAPPRTAMRQCWSGLLWRLSKGLSRIGKRGVGLELEARGWKESGVGGGKGGLRVAAYSRRGLCCMNSSSWDNGPDTKSGLMIVVSPIRRQDGGMDCPAFIYYWVPVSMDQPQGAFSVLETFHSWRLKWVQSMNSSKRASVILGILFSPVSIPKQNYLTIEGICDSDKNSNSESHNNIRIELTN